MTTTTDQRAERPHTTVTATTASRSAWVWPISSVTSVGTWRVTTPPRAMEIDHIHAASLVFVLRNHLVVDRLANNAYGYSSPLNRPMSRQQVPFRQQEPEMAPLPNDLDAHERTEKAHGFWTGVAGLLRLRPPRRTETVEESLERALADVALAVRQVVDDDNARDR